MLDELGYVVLEAESAGEALEIAGATDGPIDLLLTDVIMPGMSGDELARKLLADRPEMQVILMTGYPGDVLDSAPDDDREAFPILPKPFDVATLASLVRDRLDSRSD
jgi:CheY-like chemotaxis protein